MSPQAPQHSSENKEDRGKSKSAVVAVVPLGRLDEVALSVTAAHLQAVLGLPTEVTPPWPEPEYALIPTRRQYDAGLILKALAEDATPHKIRLGLMNGDLCLPILTYVYGEAQVEGRAAVVSLHRLGHDAAGIRVSQARFYERLAKVVLHEAAHVLGLSHCRTSGCLMRFSLAVDQLDSLSMTLCPACEQELAWRRRRLTGRAG